MSRATAVLAGVLLVAAATTAAVLSGVAPGGGAPSRTDVPTVRRLLTERLQERNLTFRYVACVEGPARYEGGPVVRCNVNFNAPHIEVYCGVVRDGGLLTDHESASVPCPRDRRGEESPVVVRVG